SAPLDWDRRSDPRAARAAGESLASRWSAAGGLESRPHLFKLRTISAMRKIDTQSFVRATRSTSRDINRRILLNLGRGHQPVSRADLARHMRVSRGVVTSLVDELLGDGAIYEGTTADAVRGRKPTMLHVRT